MKILFMSLVGILGLTSAYGQGVVFKRNDEIAQPKVRGIIKLNNLVGKTIWYIPTPKAPIKIRIGFSDKKDASISELLYPESPIQFTVETVTPPFKSTSALALMNAHTQIREQMSVRFPDGKISFLYWSELSTKVGIEQMTVEDILDENITRVQQTLNFDKFQECFYLTDPQLLTEKIATLKAKADSILAAKMEAQRNEDKIARDALLKAEDKMRREASSREAARVARGPVVIGMSHEQVLASSWGKPKSINKTITGSTVHEQWIYSSTRFLYFQNGVLITIQTSE